MGWKEGTLTFIEVKSRASGDREPPERAVDAEKERLLERSARDYARRAGVDWDRVRFDIVSVIFERAAADRMVPGCFWSPAEVIIQNHRRSSLESTRRLPELRKDPITGRWVIVATDRAKRPMDFSRETVKPAANGFCPFCYGAEREDTAGGSGVPLERRRQSAGLVAARGAEQVSGARD